MILPILFSDLYDHTQVFARFLEVAVDAKNKDSAPLGTIIIRQPGQVGDLTSDVDGKPMPGSRVY